MKRLVFALTVLQLFSACNNDSESSKNVLTIANEALLNSIAPLKVQQKTYFLHSRKRKLTHSLPIKQSSLSQPFLP